MIFLHQNLEGWTQPCGYFFIIEDNDWWINYSKLIIYSPYIEKLLLTSVNPELSQMQQKLKVSPNPATTHTWLQLPENTLLAQIQIELYSPTGRLLYKAQPTSRFHKIEVEHLPKGLYLVRVWDGERLYAEKLVVR